MIPTSLSLLNRLRQAAPDASDWQRLHDIYLPLIRSWMRRVPGIDDEANDLAQEVLVILFRELPSFERRRDGSFRAWLRQITLNRLRAFHKARGNRPFAGGGDATEELLVQLEDPTSDLARKWDRDHDRHVFDRLLTLVRPDFGPDTWAAFTRFAVEGRHRGTPRAARRPRSATSKRTPARRSPPMVPNPPGTSRRTRGLTRPGTRPW
jgi:RNA polymerase sigma-70 factor (ECF subfamily)